MRNIKNKALLLVITIYLVIEINLIARNALIFTNIINPIFWSCILIYAIYDVKKRYIRTNVNKKYLAYMIMISSIHVILYFYIGFIFGFTKSPYSHKLLTLLRNLIIKLIPLIGIEIARWILLKRNKDNKFLTAYITILLILLEINYNVVIDLFTNRRLLFQYIFSDIISIIATGILYTFLTLRGSAYLSIIYKLFIESMVIFLPILPSVDWFVRGTMGILAPTITYLIFKYEIFINDRKNKMKKQNNSTKYSFIVALIIIFVLIFFVLGFFKYEPISILSNSMKPTFERADVLILRKLDEDELKNLKKGQIIVYKLGEQYIAHRINSVIKENEVTLYQTKGDNNNVSDAKLVKIEQIKGLYVFHIKYLGYPSILLYSFLNN